MKLRDVTISRYRALSTGAISLGDLTTLVGANGSGKSTVLRAIQFLCCGSSQGEVATLNGRPALSQLLCQRGDPLVAGTIEIELLDLPGLQEEMKVQIGGAAGWRGGQFQMQRKFSRAAPTQCPLELILSQEQKNLLGSHATKFSATIEGRLKDRVVLVPAERVLGSEQYNAGTPHERDGHALLRKLHELSVDRTQHLSDVVDELEHLLRSVFPEITSLRVVQRNGNYDFEINKKEKFNSAWMGSGHREILVMLGEVLLSKGLAMVEEPERSLHPRLQRMVLPLLERAATGRQLLVCTHSPAVVSSAPLDSLFRVAAPTVEKVTSATVANVVADLGISFADSMNHRLILLVEGDDDAAVWNSWFRTFGMATDCTAIDTRGFTNVGFYAESDFLKSLTVRPIVCASLDGDTKHKREGATAEANASRAAREFGGVFFTLEGECIDAYLLRPSLLARAWGRNEDELVKSIDILRVDWAARKTAGKPIDVQSKWILDRLYPEFANSNASPESIRRVAIAMAESEISEEVRLHISKLRALARP